MVLQIMTQHDATYLVGFLIMMNDWQSLLSMESSSYENWDEIEMLFGHLVNSNLQLVIAITIAMVFNWTDQSVRLECLSWKIGESESQSVLIIQILDRSEFLGRPEFRDRLECLCRLEFLDRVKFLLRVEFLDRLKFLDRLEFLDWLEFLDRLECLNC